jgi:hypothetical protein
MKLTKNRTYIFLNYFLLFVFFQFATIQAVYSENKPKKASIDNPIEYAESLVESEWGVPSWTKMLKALNTVKKSYTSTNIANLEKVLLEMKAFDVPYSVNASYNGEPTTQMGLAWYTNADVSGGKAQVIQKENAVESDFNTPLIEVNSSTVAIENTNYLSNVNTDITAATSLPVNTKRSYTSNKALITGLNPHTVYSYRVGKDGAWSDIYSFRTAPIGNNEFSFIYLTDTQAHTESMFKTSQLTLETALQILPDPQFISVHGDLVESYGGSISSEWEYEQWFDRMSSVISRFPLVSTAGNHDINKTLNLHHHLNTSLDFDNNYLEGASVMPGMTYAFVTGDALIFVVNFEDAGARLYAALDKYMTKMIKDYPDKKWRIMFNHSSMYTGGVQHHASSQSRDIRNGFSYFMKKHRIDLALQGHSHVYEVIGPVNHTTRSLIPNSVSEQNTVTASFPENVTGKENGLYNVEGGTLFVLNNSAGKKKYQPQTKEQMDAKYSSTGVQNYWGLMSGKFGQSGDPTFSKVRVTTDTIYIDTYEVKDNGTAVVYDKLRVVRGSVNTNVTNNASTTLDFHYDNVESKLRIDENKKVSLIEIYNLFGQKLFEVKNANEVNLGKNLKGIHVIKASVDDQVVVENFLL